MKICLSMIVKNEEARILRCLNSVAPYISCYAILDTGSTDDTRYAIRAFFRDRGIRGELHNEIFTDFSTTRNSALALGLSFDVDFDYFLFVDADMELVAEAGFPQSLDPSVAVYQMVQRSGSLSYWNTRMLRRDVKALYRGVTHEYLDYGDAKVGKTDLAYFIDHADGANRPGKFERDIDSLTRGLVREPDNARYQFYLARSYHDLREFQKAAQHYRKRVEMGGWDEEVFCANLYEARCYREMEDYPAFIHTALEAYQRRPSRAEPLYDLAKHYRDKSQQATAMVFAEAGLNIPVPADLLFVENHVYQWGFREEVSICGFYSNDPGAKEMAGAICDDLALDQSIPPLTRYLAWSNLFFYAKPLSEIASSFMAKKLDFEPPDGLHPLNPSVCRMGDRMVLNIRTVNYLIGDDGRYIMPSGAAATRNFLFDLSPELAITLRCEVQPDLGPVLFNQCLGIEDLRLFVSNGNLSFSATTRQMSLEGWCEICVGEIHGSGHVALPRIIVPPGPKRPEKNWMPVSHNRQSMFVYSCDPTIVLNDMGDEVLRHTPPIDAQGWGGSSQLVHFEGGYLALVHERRASLDTMRGQRSYQRRFVWFDKNLQICSWSQRFYFGDGEGEFVCGMCWHPEGNRLVISYGVLDREAWVATIDALEVKALLEPPINVDGADGAEDYVESADKIGAASGEWVAQQTNRTLRSKSDIETATSYLRAWDLPQHRDAGFEAQGITPPKNWDNFLAVWHANDKADPETPVLDAGGDRNSAFLPGLRNLGFTKCVNLNLAEHSPRAENGICFMRGDITEPFFDASYFGFIVCLSVIEHGVDWRAFLREAHRTLKPLGHLFVSFDYWDTPIDTGDRMAFGAPVKIFSLGEAAKMIHYAEGVGLSVIGSVDLMCGPERPVSWMGMDFTFANLLFRKREE